MYDLLDRIIQSKLKKKEYKSVYKLMKRQVLVHKNIFPFEQPSIGWLYAQLSKLAFYL